MIFDFKSFIEFIYCGTVLDNEKSLQEYNIRAGTMIQVYQKQYDMEFKSEQASSEQIQKAVTCYRNIFKEMASSSTAVLNSKQNPFNTSTNSNQFCYFLLHRKQFGQR